MLHGLERGDDPTELLTHPGVVGGHGGGGTGDAGGLGGEHQAGEVEQRLAAAGHDDRRRVGERDLRAATGGIEVGAVGDLDTGG